MRLIKDKRSLSIIGKRYENASFETAVLNNNSKFDEVFLRCAKYCDNYEKILKTGQGMYIRGDLGVGKTYLISCMANYLTFKNVQVLATNIFEIINAMNFTYSKESVKFELELMQIFINTEFVFVDDLGMDFNSQNPNFWWVQNLFFNLLNKRYNNKKPTIFASSYCLKELHEICGISKATIDRIYEMTNNAILDISGESLRPKFSNQTILF